MKFEELLIAAIQSSEIPLRFEPGAEEAVARPVTQALQAWIDEHRASFEAARTSDLETAERELGHLAHATAEARAHVGRLTDLLLAGYTIDPAKRLPRDLARLVAGRQQ